MGALVAALLVGAVFSAGAQAAPGDLDPTFASGGKQRTDFGLGPAWATATTLQPNGKIVVAGYALRSNPCCSDFALARYNPDGSLDTSFSGNGKQTTDFGNTEQATGVALQGDGKIVVVGGTGSGLNGDFALARYNPNGSLDTSFSGDGRQTTDFGGADNARGVAIQGDGKIVAVGLGAGSDFALARYNPNGSLDTSFSGDGRQTTDFGATDQPFGLAVQADGKIVAAGNTGSGLNFDFALARYNPGGSLDTSFSGDGKQTTDFGEREFAFGVALQGDGKIVTVGEIAGNGFSDFALARYNPDGSLDTSFSGDGRQTTDFGGFDQAHAVALQGDGKIVAAGGASVGGHYALARYDPDGSLDTSFSEDGKQTTDFGSSVGVSAVVLQGDGKIVAAGGGRFALARYNPDGSLDLSFSGDGQQTTSFGGFDQANAVALQGDGKIVAVGGTGSGSGIRSDVDFALVRYNPNGSLDTSFSGDGRQTTDFTPAPPDGGFREQATAVALQGDGKIVAVGDNGGDFALARYNPNGLLDTSFSDDGTETTDIDGGDDRATAVALQGDGKIVVLGRGGPARGFALARYNPDGSPDLSFSGDGQQTTSFVGGVDRATGLVLQGDSKIVVAGGADGNFALARYNPNGSLDSSFSGDGKQTTDFGGSDAAHQLALQGDGKPVVVGRGLGGNFALARYNPNGSLDPSFSGDGKQTTDFGGADAANGVILQGNGRIVAVGGGGGNFALARYNPNGSLDSSFSGDGKQTTDFGGADVANGVALQGDGRIVAVGVGLGTDATSDFAFARYLGE